MLIKATEIQIPTLQAIVIMQSFIQGNRSIDLCQRGGDLMSIMKHRSGGDLLNIHHEELEWWEFTN